MVGTSLMSKYLERESIFAGAKLVQARQPLLLVLGLARVVFKNSIQRFHFRKQINKVNHDDKDLGDPELLLVLHDIRQHSSADEHLAMITMVKKYDNDGGEMKKKVMTTRVDLKDVERGLTISFLLGGSSILILNLASRSVSP